MNRIAAMVGIDFDNTIVCYDPVFYRVARDLGMIPEEVAKTKQAVRDFIRSHLSDQDWTSLQSEVYGPRLLEADPYSGVKGFFMACSERGVPVGIISHKSRYPAAGKPYDLHRSALAWLEANGFFATDAIHLLKDQLVFATSRKEKIEHIIRQGCTYFIDDLPEVFAEPDFPAAVRKVLFDPHDTYAGWAGGIRARSWVEIRKAVFGDGAFRINQTLQPNAAGPTRSVR